MERLLDTKEAAEYLGVKVSTIQRWCRDRELGFYMLGKRYRFAAKDLTARLQIRTQGDVDAEE